MHEIIAYIAGAIMLAGMAPYIIDTVKGKTKPNIVSWFTWTLLTGIATAAALSEGAITTAILSGTATLSTFIVVLLGLRSGVKRYTKFDVLCQAFALVGIVLWQTSQDAAIATAIVVTVDIIACLPTVRHAWQSPHAETWQTFFAGGVAAFITLFTITQGTFVALAYPVYLTVANIVIPAIILYRRRQLAEEK